MTLVVVTPPVNEPLTASEVRTRLGLSASVSDELLDPLIKAARQMIDGPDGWLGRSIINRTIELRLHCFPPSADIRLPFPPVASITSVKYTDASGVEQTVDPALYQTIGAGGAIYLALKYGSSWPTARSQDEAVRIRYVAGYGANGSDVPEPIRSAIALQVSHLRSLSERNLFLRSDQVDGVGEKQWTVSPAAGDVIDKTVSALLGPYRVYA